MTRIIGGGTPTRGNAAFYGGDIPWVTPKDMKRWIVNDSQVRITQQGLDGSAARLVPSGSVLIVVRSGVLKHTVPVAMNRRPVAINQDMKALICDQSVFPDYLARFIKERSGTILQWVRATTADNFPIANLKTLKMPLPPIHEQRRIAQVLDHVDGLRGKRREAIALLDELAQSIFLDMFGNSRHDWPCVTVEDLTVAGKGSIRTGPFGSQLLHEEFVESGIAVLGIDNAVDNEFKWGERRYVTEEKYMELARYTVRPGDVIITIMGTCGRCAVVPDDIPLAINTKHLCCITLDQSRCLPEFLHSYFLIHPSSRDYLARHAKGAIMAGLNMGIIKKLPVTLPPLEQQAEFVKRIQAVRQAKAEQERHLAELDALFASLQYRAFCGGLWPDSTSTVT
ncbi:restriction endonuclease subunit S [Streptomyces sp. CT34]|uniref:restriction endonuclease subunit S n=1 Tax=Streptomyces sp. CT34 TaxID=1553907 RepID=UPI0018E37BD7|nr:restriction endonuclease subunit S [Streptomyces sp. CT34]